MTEGTSSTNPLVHVAECVYTPTVLHVEEGTKVRWLNKDIFDHTVSGANGSWGDEAPIAQGESVAYRFDESGTYPYYCLFHPGMTGTVVVGDGQGTAASGSSASPFNPVVVSAFETDEAAETQPKPAPVGDEEDGMSALAIAGLCALMLAAGYAVRSLRGRKAAAVGPQTAGLR